MVNNVAKLTPQVIDQLTKKMGEYRVKEIIKDCKKFDRAYSKREKAVKDINNLRNIVLKRYGFDDPNTMEAFDFCGGNLIRNYTILEKIEFSSYSKVIHNQIRNINKSKYSVHCLNAELGIFN